MSLSTMYRRELHDAAVGTVGSIQIGYLLGSRTAGANLVLGDSRPGATLAKNGEPLALATSC